MKESDSDVATGTWKVSRPLGKHPCFLGSTLLCHQPGQAFREGPLWCPKGPCQLGAQFTSWRCPQTGEESCGASRAPLGGPHQALPNLPSLEEQQGESPRPRAASFHPSTHDPSFLFPPTTETHARPQPQRALFRPRHNATLVAGQGGSPTPSLARALALERGDFRPHLSHFLASRLLKTDA